ncbi:MAG: TonB-dependent receptor [Caulobacteraceae bacterium]|nr:TonB-dependent receptor [Caulobacteraceae bacterium]
MKIVLTAGAAVCALLAGAAQAQVIQTPTADPSSAADQTGVLVFTPDFFADARPRTALDMIARLPGFAFNPGDQGTRGFAGAAGNVLIDGDRPASKSDGLEGVLRRISADSVERIELIRGGAPGIDMQGQTVVANVVLKRTVTTERVLETNAYFYPDGYVGPILAGQWSRREGENQTEASFSTTTDRTDGTSDGFRRRYDTSGALIQDADLVLWDRFRNARVTGGLQRTVGGGRLRVNGLLNWQNNENEQDLLIRSGPGADSFNVEENSEVEGEFGVNWSRDLSPRTSIELTALQRYEVEDYVGDSASAGQTSTFTADATGGESIARGVFRFRPNDRWAYETGGEVAYNFLDSDTAYSENGVPVPLGNSSVKVEELRGEVFGQATWRPSDRWTVEAGMRVEVSEISQSGDSDLSKSFVYPKPRVQATFTPAPGHQFRVRVEREVGQLDFGDFVASADIDIGQVEAGNPDLEPHKAWIFEGVYERRFWDQGVFDVTYMHAEVEDVVDVIPLTGGFEGVGNIGDGVQDFFQLRLTLPTDRLGIPGGRLIARGSWSWSEVTDPLTGEPRRFQGNQYFGCGVDFNQDLAGGRWSWGLQHGCNIDRGRVFRIREVREGYAEPFVTIWGQWKPDDRTTLRVDLGNATDRAIGYDRDIYAGPRDVSPVAFREVRRTQMSPWLFVQLRRTF